MTRKLVVVISDTHCGSRLALLSPHTELFDEGPNGELVPYTPELTASQWYLWNLYLETIQKVSELAGGDEVHLLHLGDEVDGSRFSEAKVTSRLSDQVVIVRDVIREWHRKYPLKSFSLVIGTPSHNFGESASAQLLTGLLEEPKTTPVYHGLISVDGLTLDCSHKGPSIGARIWLKGNTPRFYLRNIMLESLASGEKPPDVVLRGHYHEPASEYLEHGKYASRIYCLPSWSMLSDYSRDATRSLSKITHGALVLEVVDGQLRQAHRFYKTLDLRRKMEL